MEPLHILILPSWYPSPEAPTHGIFVQRHAKAIALQHRVSVVYAKAITTDKALEISSKENNLEEYFLFYPKTRSLPGLGTLLKFRRYLRAYRQLLKKIKSVDIVHVHVAFPAGLIYLLLLRHKKTPLVVTEHWSGYYPEDGNYKGFLLTSVTRRLIKAAASVSVISEKLKNSMLQQGLQNQYQLIHNVVDTTVFYPAPTVRSEAGPLKILHVSSLVEREKNISGILRVAHQLKQRGFSFMLSIVGANPEEEPAHRALAQQLGLQEDIRFEGFKAPAEVAATMREQDVFLLLSHFEGMPVVLLEAMACGLPVIATPVGAVPSMIQNNFGNVLPKENTEQACADMLEHFRHQHWASKEAMHTYIQQTYSPEAVAQQFDRQYREALNA